MYSFEFDSGGIRYRLRYNGMYVMLDVYQDNQWCVISNDSIEVAGICALLRELTTAREQIAGLEREQAKDAVEWADLCLAHKKEAEAARTALAEKEAELAVFHERSRKSGDVMYWIAEHDVEHAKVLSLEAENPRLRAELAEARSERQREHDLRVTLAGEVESLRYERNSLYKRVGGIGDPDTRR